MWNSLHLNELNEMTSLIPVLIEFRMNDVLSLIVFQFTQENTMDGNVCSSCCRSRFVVNLRWKWLSTVMERPGKQRNFGWHFLFLDILNSIAYLVMFSTQSEIKKGSNLLAMIKIILDV